MLNLFYRALNNKKGFTLIEVLVVVAIIGILAALAAPMVLGRIDQARVSSDQALARQLTSAVEQWIVDNELKEDPDEATGILAPDSYEALAEYLDKASQDALPKDGDGNYISIPDVGADSGVSTKSRGKIIVVKHEQKGTTTIAFEYQGVEEEEEDDSGA